MSDSPQIQHLGEFLSAKLQVKVVKHEVSAEDLNDEFFKIGATVEENGEEKLVHALARVISPTSSDIANNQTTFKNELEVYTNILPAIREFQKEFGVPTNDYFPEFYGARNNLKPSGDHIDNDAIILLENLKAAGYSKVDKKGTMDLHSTKAILRALANIQATVLALRKTKPDVFNSQILPYFHDWARPNEPLDLEVILNENPDTAPLVNRVKKALAKKRLKKIREPWATLTLWGTSIMVKPTDDGIDGVKFVDFQMDYGSPAIDVLFFLLTSVQVSVLRYHFDKLLQHYFKEFTNALLGFKIDTTAYTYQSFWDELKIESPYEIYRSLFELFKAHGAVDEVPGKVSIGIVNGQTLSNGTTSKSPKNQLVKCPFNLKERIWCIIEEASKQNWI